MLADRKTLNHFLIEEGGRDPTATGDLNSLINQVAMSCKLVADRVARGALGQGWGDHEPQGDRAESKQKLAAYADDAFLRIDESHLAAMMSDAIAEPLVIRPADPEARYLLLFSALDGLSDIDINVPSGSTFSILRAPRASGSLPSDFLQPGKHQLCAGYALYGPSTMLIVTVGAGVNGFTLDPDVGEFILTHPAMRVHSVSEFAVNASSSRFWEPAIQRYVAECLAGQSGPRHRNFNMRSVGSLVAETQRILVRGGIFIDPRDATEPPQLGRLHLLCKANPIALLIERAGGSASTGRERVTDIVPTSLDRRVPLIFGSSDEVSIIESYHGQSSVENFDAPLFGSRGLFRVTA